MIFIALSGLVILKNKGDLIFYANNTTMVFKNFDNIGKCFS